MKTWNALSSSLALALLFSISQTALARAEEDEDLLGKLQFHGYGELHYNNPKIDTMSSGAGNVIDVHRFVLGWEYEFTENLRVEAELDYEHAAKELELEEAYLEYDLLPAVSLRVGTLLMPVGPLTRRTSRPSTTASSAHTWSATSSPRPGRRTAWAWRVSCMTER